MLFIRPFQPKDQTAVVKLWHTCKLVVPHNDPCQDIARKLKVNPEWFLVGEDDDRIVATCMAGYDGHRGWINYLAVAPEHRRRKIATRLMQAVEVLLREAGCPKINLQVRAANRQVVKFYEQIGFKQDEVVSLGKRLQQD